MQPEPPFQSEASSPRPTAALGRCSARSLLHPASSTSTSAPSPAVPRTLARKATTRPRRRAQKKPPNSSKGLPNSSPRSNGCCRAEPPSLWAPPRCRRQSASMCKALTVAHHKRKRPEHHRGGCLLCKPQKLTANAKRERRRSRQISLQHERAADRETEAIAAERIRSGAADHKEDGAKALERL